MIKKVLFPKPKGKSWQTSKLYNVYFGMGFPVSGLRLVHAVVGRKNVRICLPVCKRKFTIKRKVWDGLNPMDRELVA